MGESQLRASPAVGVGEAVRTRLRSPAHRAILLDRRRREIGLASVSAPSAPGVYDGFPVTILTADFGVRR